MKSPRLCLLVLSLFVAGQSVYADPCGMVPPMFLTGVSPIQRVGVQKTYVFYKNGVETFVIRPGYRGKVDNFGMLIPFPTPPEIRKVPDTIFAHIAAAIDPPEVVVDLTPRRELYRSAKNVVECALPESALGRGCRVAAGSRRHVRGRGTRGRQCGGSSKVDGRPRLPVPQGYGQRL